MVEAIKQTVANMLHGIERYNPENTITLERYVDIQVTENIYDLEANLALLKLYQINLNYNMDVTCKILLKALTNFPHTDFTLCKCLLSQKQCSQNPVKQIIQLANLLESCDFENFWVQVYTMPDQIKRIVGFHDSIRKFVCHVVGITFQTINRSLLTQLLGRVDDQTLKQWVDKYGWREDDKDMIFIANQDEIIKTKNITEKIDFDAVANIMASCR